MISIIIPVYNTEKYLRECLSSVLAQTYKNFEVILIDDGSTDASPQIGKTFAQEDSRIQFYIRNHQGVSMARNEALDMAKGEYIFFLDSDDMIAPTMLECLFTQIKHQKVEMCFCQYLKNSFFDAFEINEEKTSIVYHYQELMEQICKNPSLFGIGGKLISREAIGELRFDKEYVFGEDTIFLYELFQKGISACYITEKMYYYRMREGNTRSLRFTVRGLTDICKVNKHLELAEQQCGRVESATIWESRYLENIKNILIYLPKSEWKNIRSVVKKEFKDPYFHRNPLKMKMSIILGYFSYSLYHILRNVFHCIKIEKNKTL